jgi:general secretion pathway protein G
MEVDMLVRFRNAGFTLVELLVVMVILGLLASVVLPNFVGQLRHNKAKIARTQIQTFATALDAFALDVGRYPTEQEGLDALLIAPAGDEKWNGPYLQKDPLPKDPWGHAYEYRERDDGAPRPYDIVAYGEDGKPGGDGMSSDVALSD